MQKLPSDLKGDYIKVGFCQDCSEKEIAKIKKYFKNSFIAGAILSFIVFIVLYKVKVSYISTEKEFILYTFYISIPKLLQIISDLSLKKQIIICIGVFLIPFGHYIIFKVQTTGIEGLGILLLELLISIVSGPFLLIYILYKLILFKKTISG